MKNLCIYHGGCTDGVAAAWCFWHLLDKNATFYAGVYQKDPQWDFIESHDSVFLLDFSYKRPVLEEMVARKGHVEGDPPPIHIIDHHKSAEEDLSAPIEGVSAQFDMSRCGALMTWERFERWHRAPPDLLVEIDKQDRWLDDRDPELIMALRSYPHKPEKDTTEGFEQLMLAWNDLMKPSRLEKLKSDGMAIYRYYRQRVDETKAHAADIDIGGFQVPAVNAPYYLASDVAGELSTESESGIGAVWWQNSDGSKTYSLRSRGDVDVSELAVRFGGGGHKNAAGFKVAAK